MKFLAGDIIEVDSVRAGALMVKFLQQSPTLWHWLAGKIYQETTGNKAPAWLIDEVRFYHVAMALNETEIIEQQGTVIVSPASRLKGKKFIVWRNITLNDIDRAIIVSGARQDLSHKYDVLLFFGKTLTWLTGIGLFSMIVQWGGQEICATMVAKWHWSYDHFGRKSHSTITGDDIDDWCSSNDRYKVVDVKEEDL